MHIDDILVVGATEEEHLKRLVDILSRLEEQMQVHGAIGVIPCSKIDGEGLNLLPDEVNAVLEAPT